MTNLRVWAGLIALTLVEVALAWANAAPGAMLALLLILSFAKAAMIAWWFMHLKQHRPAPLLLLLPFLFVCVGLLLALIPDGVRAGATR